MSYFSSVNTGEYHACSDVTSNEECLDIPCPEHPFPSVANTIKDCNYANECQIQNKGIDYNASGNCPYLVCKCYYSLTH